MAITVTVDSKEVMDHLRRLQARMSNFTSAMTAVGMELQSRSSQRFEVEKDPEGKSWDDWTLSTKKTYPEDGNFRFLDRYSDMIDSLGFKADSQSVIVGFGQPYAAYHEFGTKKMARRGLLFADPVEGTLAPEGTQALLDILNRMIQKLLQK